MSTAGQQQLRKPQPIEGVWEMLRMAFCLGPVIWCLKMYDDHWASKFRSPPNIHELARRARGESPLDAPVPLSRKRKRALTNPLPDIELIQSIPDSVRRSRQRNDDQKTCLFLTKLPFEIRQLIYEEVLAGGGGSVVHIFRKHSRLGHWRCRIQTGDGVGLCDSKGQRCLEGWLSYKARVWSADRAGRIDIITDGGLLPLLRTCRIIYSEAIDVLYSRNSFHFYDPGDIRYFGRTILPQRLDAVHSVMMDWERAFSIFNPNNAIAKQNNFEWNAWREAWGIIAQMRGLLDLRIFLKKHDFEVSKERRMKMCKPLMEVKGLRVFEVIVPWDDDNDWEFAKGAPFKIVRGLDRSASAK